MINIYDNVNAVASDLRETAQYKSLRDAVAAMQKNPEAMQVFKDFQAAQLEINTAMRSGQEPKPEAVQKWQDIAGQMDQHADLKNMMAAEQAVNALLQEINDIVTKPIAELYDI